MTDQEQRLVYELNSTEADRILWKTTAIKQGNEIAALKAQVNCLRKALLEQRSRYHVAKDLDAVLEATPEQCLAEVKAKAIEDAVPKMIKACVKYTVEKYIDTSVEMVSIGQLKHLSEMRHHGEWGQAK